MTPSPGTHTVGWTRLAQTHTRPRQSARTHSREDRRPGGRSSTHDTPPAALSTAGLSRPQLRSPAAGARGWNRSVAAPLPPGPLLATGHRSARPSINSRVTCRPPTPPGQAVMRRPWQEAACTRKPRPTGHSIGTTTGSPGQLVWPRPPTLLSRVLHAAVNTGHQLGFKATTAEGVLRLSAPESTILTGSEPVAAMAAGGSTTGYARRLESLRQTLTPHTSERRKKGLLLLT
jgi:hypothetical protein